MCGIAGYYSNRAPADARMVEAMCDQIRHRGPDDSGVYVNGGCGIGMRRLSIIDLSSGHQPMSNEDDSIWAVFNGEIYNFQELRQELIKQGHRFKTNSDTEVLVHLYEQEGPQGIAKLRGMFAFAIWDVTRQQMLIARDRFGKKPLYYSVRPEGLYFASELKCLRVHPIPLEQDDEALKWYFLFNYIPDPYSCFRDVRKLPAASWLLYKADGSVSTGTYWQLPPPETSVPARYSEEECCDQLRHLFDESVRIRMIADVPLGAFLSGGIDSSLVVASMAMQSSAPVKTFSIGFEESAFDETVFAREVAKRYGTDHHELFVKPNSIELVPKLVQHFDEPFADSSAIPTFLVSQFAVTGVKVALSGDGGDELFGGYTSFFQVNRMRRFDAIPQVARKVISAAADALPYSAFGKNYLRGISRPSALARYFESSYSPYFLRQHLLDPKFMLPPDTAGSLMKAFPGSMIPGSGDVLSQAMYFEAIHKLTGDILVKVDRMSMANSLEVRSPLLDHRLAEFSSTIPNYAKIQDGKGKRILLKAFADRLPPSLLDRPKKGFSVPVAAWFRGPLRDYLNDNLLSPDFLNSGIVSPTFVKKLISEHQKERRDNSHWLWSLLMLEGWRRQFRSGV